jgi:F0F1-type ATP synthase membrane subunit b/b'
MNPIIYQWINFLILVFGLGFLLKKQLGAHFRKERATLEERISTARAEHEEMRTEFAATQNLMNNLQSRISEMKSASLREIQFETKKIELESERAVEKMFLDAESKIKADVERIKKSLEKELMEKSLAAARQALQKELQTKDGEWTSAMIQASGNQEDSHTQGRKNYAT